MNSVFSSLGPMVRLMGAPPPEGGGGFMTFMPLVAIIAIFYFLILRPQRKKQQETQKMLSAIKKNDRVMTIGGVIGSVVAVSDSEVTLKVDESANVKITFIRSAIQRVLREDERPGEL